MFVVVFFLFQRGGGGIACSSQRDAPPVNKILTTVYNTNRKIGILAASKRVFETGSALLYVIISKYIKPTLMISRQRMHEKT